MRTNLLLIAISVVVAVAHAQRLTVSPTGVVLAPATSSDTPVLACRVAYATLEGDSTFSGPTKDERTCFYTCANAKSSPWYSWNQDTKECLCFQYISNITKVVTKPEGLVPSFSYAAYGNVDKCFPFCSVAVNKCARCRTKTGGVMCVTSWSRPRCCCTPPSKVIIRKGQIAGCTKTDRQALEVGRQMLETLDPMYTIQRFDALLPGSKAHP